MARTVTIPDNVADTFLARWDTSLAGDLAEQLTCTEANALVDLLAALGADDAAAVWAQAHADGDEPGTHPDGGR